MIKTTTISSTSEKPACAARERDAIKFLAMAARLPGRAPWRKNTGLRRGKDFRSAAGAIVNASPSGSCLRTSRA